MKISDIIAILEDFAPLSYAESYDNVGLLVGHKETPVQNILLTVDVNEDCIMNAIEKNCNLIISHHPPVFKPLKHITGSSLSERLVELAIKNDISLYACHTNLDSVKGGVSWRLCEILGLKDIEILQPISDDLVKLVTFVPENHADKVRKSLFSAGSGHIGLYDSCSYNTSGYGTFRALEGADPFVGKIGEIHKENEVKIETIIPKSRLYYALSEMHKSHPYQEVAYDIIPLLNKNQNVGFGAFGRIEREMDFGDFIDYIKGKFDLQVIKHSKPTSRKISKVAVCSGSGNSSIPYAIAKKADIFISSELKHNEFIDCQNRIAIADIGHFESEKCSIEILYDLIRKKIPTFAGNLVKYSVNPVIYG